MTERGSVDESIAAMSSFTEGFSSKPPHEQHRDRQVFVMAFAAGLLQEMTEDPPLYPEKAGRLRYAMNQEMRRQIQEFILENPDSTPLVWLKEAMRLLEEVYEELSGLDSTFKYEGKLASNVCALVKDRPDIVDDQLAIEILAMAELGPSTT